MQGLSFTPKTEDQLVEETLWPEGDYPFEVIEANYHESKAGKSSIKLRLRCFNQENQSRLITDYLTAGMEFKLRHFCSTTGIMERYESGTLQPEDCVKCHGVVTLRKEIDESGQYPPKNVVKDYVKKDEPNSFPGDQPFDDEIPFH